MSPKKQKSDIEGSEEEDVSYEESDEFLESEEESDEESGEEEEEEEESEESEESEEEEPKEPKEEEPKEPKKPKEEEPKEPKEPKEEEPKEPKEPKEEEPEEPKEPKEEEPKEEESKEEPEEEEEEEEPEESKEEEPEEDKKRYQEYIEGIDEGTLGSEEIDMMKEEEEITDKMYDKLLDYILSKEKTAKKTSGKKVKIITPNEEELKKNLEIEQQAKQIRETLKKKPTIDEQLFGFAPKKVVAGRLYTTEAALKNVIKGAEKGKIAIQEIIKSKKEEKQFLADALSRELNVAITEGTEIGNVQEEVEISHNISNFMIKENGESDERFEIRIRMTEIIFNSSKKAKSSKIKNLKIDAKTASLLAKMILAKEDFNYEYSSDIENQIIIPLMDLLILESSKISV